MAIGEAAHSSSQSRARPKDLLTERVQEWHGVFDADLWIAVMRVPMRTKFTIDLKMAPQRKSGRAAEVSGTKYSEWNFLGQPTKSTG